MRAPARTERPPKTQPTSASSGFGIARKSLAWAAFSGKLGAAGQGVRPQIRLAIELGDAELDALVLSRTSRIGIVRDGLSLAEADRQETPGVDAVREQPLFHRDGALTRERQALFGRPRVVGVTFDAQAGDARILVEIGLDLAEHGLTPGTRLKGRVVGLEDDVSGGLELRALDLDVRFRRSGGRLVRRRFSGRRRLASGLLGFPTRLHAG